MGEVVSTENAASYVETLEYVESWKEKNFGMVDIFRSRESPYEYVMDYKKTFIDGDQRLAKYMQFMAQVRAVEHKNLAKVYLCELREENNMCIKDRRVHTYTNYYNFTLDQAIAKKKKTTLAFPQSQLLYVFGSLVELSLFLQKSKLVVGDFRTENIYLSPEGYVKVYLLEIEENNRHSCYFRALTENQSIPKYILAPQQLEAIANMDYEVTYDPYKADLFAIAMVILELITLDKTRFYYNETRTELRIGKIEFNLSTVASIYSEPFLNLLKHCLQPDPSHRPAFSETFDAIMQLRNSSKSSSSYCIRLADDEERDKKQLRPELSMNAKGLHILQGLQKKLMPSPITTLSGSTFSSLKSESQKYQRTSTGSRS